MANATYLTKGDSRISPNTDYEAVRVNNRPNRFSKETEVTFKISVPKGDPAKIGTADWAFINILDDLDIAASDIPVTGKATLQFANNNNGYLEISHISI